MNGFWGFLVSVVGSSLARSLACATVYFPLRPFLRANLHNTIQSLFRMLISIEPLRIQRFCDWSDFCASFADDWRKDDTTVWQSILVVIKWLGEYCSGCVFIKLSNWQSPNRFMNIDNDAGGTQGKWVFCNITPQIAYPNLSWLRTNLCLSNVYQNRATLKSGGRCVFASVKRASRWHPSKKHVKTGRKDDGKYGKF